MSWCVRQMKAWRSIRSSRSLSDLVLAFLWRSVIEREMATRFVNVDHDTPLLLPPDLRQWVPQKHLVHFVMDRWQNWI